MIPIPNYLREIATLKRDKKDYIDLDIKCTCGCNKFTIYKNIIEKSEEEIEYEAELEAFWKRHPFSYSVERFKDGKTYCYKKYLFGLFVDKVEVKRFDCTEILKIKCLDCQKEYVLFDSRFNGYDAIEPDKEYLNKEYEFKKKVFRPSEDIIQNIVVSIYNDRSLEDFIEATGEENTTEEEYANCFGCIKIVGETHDGKKKEIFNRESI